MDSQFLCPSYAQWLSERPRYARSQMYSLIDSAKLFIDQLWITEAVAYSGKALETAWLLAPYSDFESDQLIVDIVSTTYLHLNALALSNQSFRGVHYIDRAIQQIRCIQDKGGSDHFDSIRLTSHLEKLQRLHQEITRSSDDELDVKPLFIGDLNDIFSPKQFA